MYHNTIERQMMERENLGLCNELELSSIPAFQALGSTTVKKRAKKKKKNLPAGLDWEIK